MWCDVKELSLLLAPLIACCHRLSGWTLLTDPTSWMKFFVWLQTLVAISQVRVVVVGGSAATEDTSSSLAASFVLDTNVAVVFAIPADVKEFTVVGEAYVSSSNTLIVTPADATTSASTPKLTASPFMTAKGAAASTPTAAEDQHANEADSTTGESRISDSEIPTPSKLPAAEAAKFVTPEVASASDTRSRSAASNTHVQFAIRGGSVKSRGVNLSGWLVVEHWMTKNAEIWWGLSIDDADRGEFAAMNRTRRVLAAQRAEAHRDHFLTECDIEEIARAGINTVHVPVGCWIVGFDRHDPSNKHGRTELPRPADPAGPRSTTSPCGPSRAATNPTARSWASDC